MLGGIVRVVKRVEDRTQSQFESVDVGLADLRTLRQNALELSSVLEQIVRVRSPQVSNDLSPVLLLEYDKSTISEVSTDARIQQLVLTALSSSACGALVLHDLFCIVNRLLRLETVLSPGDFVDTIVVMKNRPTNPIECIDVDGWKLIVLKSKFNLRDVAGLLLTKVLVDDATAITVAEFAATMKYPSPLLAQVILRRIEMDFGCICRDDGGDFGDLKYYKNLYFSG